jgi:branched-chain amino acid transport system substrate-binding protein
MMRRPQNPLLPVLAGLAACALLAGCGGSLRSDEAPDASGGAAAPARIGLLVPTSGVYAPLGEDMKQGFEFYLAQKNQKLGGHAVTVQVVDEGASPATGVPAGQRLLQEDVNAVVGIVNSATALGLRDAFDEAKMPLIVANAGADDITGASRSDYVWRSSFSNGAVAGALGPQAAKDCKSVFLVASDYAAGKEATAGFEKSYLAAGGKVAGSVFAPFGTTTNYQPFLAKIRQSGADCAYSFFAGAEAVAFTKQYAQFGLKKSVKLYSSGFLTEGGVLKGSGDAAAGIETSLHYSDQLDTPANQAFVRDYQAKYNEAPTVYAVQAYDAANVLDLAFRTGIDGADVIKGLQGITSIESPRGTWTFDEGHGPKQTYYLRRVEPGTGGLVNKVIQNLPSAA